MGRLDFARLPVFSGLTEVDLIKRYLAKNGRYRTNGLPTFGRVSSLLGNYAETQGANASQSASGALFGVEPGRVFNASGRPGRNLRRRHLQQRQPLVLLCAV